MAMADGYAQASGQLAACNLHVAPGLGNAMGMLYDAKKAGAPILVTAGQHDQGFALKEPLLWGDLPEIARPFVKWSAEVRGIARPAADDPPRRQDRPRPAHRPGVSLAARRHHERRGRYRPRQANAHRRADPRRQRGDRGGGGDDGEGRTPHHHRRRRRGAERRTCRTRSTCRGPGRAGPRRNRAEPRQLSRRPSALRRPADTASPPRCTRRSARTTWWCRSAPTSSRCRCRERWSRCLPGMPVVHLDTDPWELGKNYPADVAILGDPKATLPDLTAALVKAQGEAGCARVQGHGQRVRATLAASLAKLRADAEALAPRQPDPRAAADGRRRRRAAGRRGGCGRNHILGCGFAAAAAQQRSAELLWFARRRHRLGPAGGDRREAGAAAPAGRGADRRRQCDVHHSGPVDGGARKARHRLHHSQQFAPIRILKQRTNAMQSLAAQTDTYVGMDLTDPRIDYVSVARGMGLAAHKATTLDQVRAPTARRHRRERRRR